MTDREALYRAILANPDDDTLRLIYADALEEEGDPAARRSSARRCTSPACRSTTRRGSAPGTTTARSSAGGGALELPQLPDGLDWAREPFRRGFPANVRPATPPCSSPTPTTCSRVPDRVGRTGRREVGRARAFADGEWAVAARAAVGGPGAQRPGREAVARFVPLRAAARSCTSGAELTTARNGPLRRPQPGVPPTHCAELPRRPGRRRMLVQELAQLADPPRLRVLDLSGNRLTAEQLGGWRAGAVGGRGTRPERQQPPSRRGAGRSPGRTCRTSAACSCSARSPSRAGWRRWRRRRSWASCGA